MRFPLKEEFIFLEGILFGYAILGISLGIYMAVFWATIGMCGEGAIYLSWWAWQTQNKKKMAKKTLFLP